METHDQLRDGILVINIVGPIDSTTGPELGRRLDAAIGRGHTHLVLDMSDVPYISSVGLRALFIALKAARAAGRGGDMFLTELSQTVSHALRISGFTQVFSVYDTVSEAIDVMVESSTSFTDE